jgi:hypothetical protein
VAEEVGLLAAMGPELNSVREGACGLAVAADEGAATADLAGNIWEASPKLHADRFLWGGLNLVWAGAMHVMRAGSRWRHGHWTVNRWVVSVVPSISRMPLCGSPSHFLPITDGGGDTPQNLGGTSTEQ